MASRKINSNRKAGFFWQGLLILLPVLVLAGFGLYFLRQDKIAAENEAKERAQTTVDDLLADISGDQFLANLSEIYFSAETMRGKTGNSVPAWFPKIGAEANVMAPMRDEIFNTWPSAAGGEVWGGLPMHLDENGQARWLGSGKAKRPVNYTHTLEPMPLDLGRLSAEQSKSWDKAQQAEFSGTDGAKAIEAYQNFLKDSPPVRFQQAAEYTLALLQARKGLVEPAITSLAKLQNADDAFTEAGLPLDLLARLKKVQLLSEGRSGAKASTGKLSEEIELLCSRAVSQPGPFTPEILNRAIEAGQLAGLKGGAEKWLGIWETDEGTRSFLDGNRAEFVPEKLQDHISWVRWNDRYWMILIRTANTTNQPTSSDPCDLYAYPELMAREAMWEVLLRSRIKIPEYASVSVALNGRGIVPATNSAGVLATASGKLKFSGHPVDGLAVSLHLSNPSLLNARQRARSLWLASLIGMAAAAALVGFFAARRAFNRQLRLSEMKSNFVSSVSHELRAPIASVRLMAEGLERGKVQAPEKQQEYFRFIVQECRRLSSLIENVLDFSRIEQGRKQCELEPTDVVAMVTETVRLMETYAAEPQIRIALKITGEPVSVEMDGKAMQQALINLLDNAIKHSPKGAEVTVGLEFGDREDGTVLILVEDKGEGIPADEQEKIFERFYRLGSELRRSTQGVGIGLSIVKHIVEAHGGTVTVRSAAGEGSRFTITLRKRGGG